MEESIILAKGRITRTAFWTRWLVVFIINVLLRVVMESAHNLVAPLTALSLVLAVFIIIQGIK